MSAWCAPSAPSSFATGSTQQAPATRLCNQIEVLHQTLGPRTTPQRDSLAFTHVVPPRLGLCIKPLPSPVRTPYRRITPLIPIHAAANVRLAPIAAAPIRLASMACTCPLLPAFQVGLRLSPELVPASLCALTGRSTRRLR
ncbi:hypothetical protein B0H13DRAFT_2307888 [Mycena leptocephala]|nr:hypothetical protein B0H13DRAFT_2307888 [Mycena leptocephala]